MATLQDILGWFMSGEGRLVAAAILFFLIWALKKLPWVGPWLDEDSGAFTSKRKKMAANIVLALAPTALMLTTDASWVDVITTGVTAALTASGLQGKLRALKPKNEKKAAT